MDQIKQVMTHMIQVSEAELDGFLKNATIRRCKRQEILSQADTIPNEIYFINKGIVRVIITDQEGTEHTIHFAMENQFIVDYSNFLQKQASMYTLQCLEETEILVLPRSAIEWGYQHMQEGEKMGRLIAEYYYIYQDNRIKNMYLRSPKERYDNIGEVFPNIHMRAPQHMIASYLGITPIHLSRLKNTVK